MMTTWRVAELVDWAGGTLLRGDEQQDVWGVSTDSRTVQAGNVFVALRGERFDGHGFVDDAVRRGAACVVVSDTACLAPTRLATNGAGPGVIGVADTEKALQDLATAHRHTYQGSVVAVTGSNGKTTVKEMIAGVLQCWLSTHKTSGNLNNHIGVPLAVLGLERLKRVLVLELGMNHLGEISRLCEIARPDVGVITNIGQAHLGGLGSVEAIQQAKGELTASLPSTGVAVVNADDPRALALGRQSAARLLTFGQSQDADVRGWVRENLGLGGTRCRVVLGCHTHDVRLRVPGTHQIMNALAAAAVGMTFGVPEERIVWALQRHRGVQGRLAVRRGRGVWLIDDTYNANPQSMLAALDFLAGVPGAGRRIAVLGDMFELGETGPALHEEMGLAVSNANIHTLIALGGNAGYIARGARQAGMECRRIHHAQSQQEVLDVLDEIAQPRDVILFKGSRGMAMERLVEALADDPGAA